MALTRQEANREIIKQLSEAIEKYPDIRFTQLLTNLDININAKGIPCTERMLLEDLFYEEPTKTLERILEKSF